MTTTAHDAPAAVPEPPAEDRAAEDLAGRLFEAGLGAFELATVTLARGSAYRALADGGPATASALAAAAGVDAPTRASGASSRPPPGC